MRRARLAVALVLAQALAAFAQQPPAQPAPAQAPQEPLPNSPLIWEIRDGNHPKLGPIRVAVPSSSIATPVGKEKILSLVFFSCERSKGKIAIELANAAESDTKGGLFPKQMPKLFCNPRSSAPRSEIPSSWFVSELGDAMARGFEPALFRRCASVEIHQDLALPRGWGADVKHIEIEVIPYKKEVDEVLATCADAPLLSAQATPPPAAPAATPKAAPVPAPSKSTVAAAAAKPATSPLPSSTAGEGPWRSAHTVTGGRTNVRSAPSIDSSAVTMLDAGTAVLVQQAGADWWRVRTHLTKPPLGYIRQDRLTFP